MTVMRPPGSTACTEALYLSDLGIFTPLELLRLWAESTPTLIFPNRRLGRLADGYEARFLVLEQDPLANPERLFRVSRRVKQGRLLP